MFGIIFPKFLKQKFKLNTLNRFVIVKHILLLLFSFFLFPAIASSEDIVDRVVAVVNEDVITLSELKEEAAPTLEKIREQAPFDQVDAASHKARREILSEMIDRKLLLQRAEKRNVSVPDAEIDAAVDRILEQNKISVEEFRTQLGLMGKTEAQYRETLRSQIIRSKLVSYEIRSKVVITNEQIIEFYNEHYGNLSAPEGYHIQQIGLSWGDRGRSGSPAEAKKRAEQIRDMVRAGESFKDMAKQQSDLPSAADGGDIGVLQKDELALYMWEAIKGLRPGEVSEIIETPAGYQFFKLISARDGNVSSQAPLDTVRDEIRNTLYDQQLKRKFDNWVKLLRENSYIEELL